MAKTDKKKAKSKKTKEDNPLARPWLSMRLAVVLIAITSVVMAVLTAWQTVPSLGWFEGGLWALLFGGLIWVIFFGNLLVNRFLRR